MCKTSYRWFISLDDHLDNEDAEKGGGQVADDKCGGRHEKKDGYSGTVVPPASPANPLTDTSPEKVVD